LQRSPYLFETCARWWCHREAGACLHRLQTVRLERMTQPLLRRAVPAVHGRIGRGWRCSAAQSVGKGGKEGLGCAWHRKSHCASCIATQLHHHGPVALTTRAPPGQAVSPWATKSESLASEPPWKGFTGRRTGTQLQEHSYSGHLRALVEPGSAPSTFTGSIETFTLGSLLSLA